MVPPASSMEITGLKLAHHESLENFHNNQKQPSLLVKENDNLRPKKREIIWSNLLILLFVHIFAPFGLYNLFYSTSFIFHFLYAYAMAAGVTVAAHRYWTHRTYKATLAGRIFLIIINSMAVQTPIYDWARDHRVHHKFTDTDADPHNARRGFFFSHVGWLLVRKNPQVIAMGKKVDMSDLQADGIVMFQKKYYPFIALVSFLTPIVIPIYFWDEPWFVSFTVSMYRYAYCLNVTWSVNSFAHFFGTRPYDKTIKPVENIYVAVLAWGEGWHNFHHVFPWDYKTGEFGNYATNISKLIIDIMAKIGWAYDLKTVSPEVILKRKNRTGIGNGQEGDHSVWGEMKEDPDIVEVLYKKKKIN